MSTFIKHGTHTGYRQHQRAGHRGIEVCEECRDAWRAYDTAYHRENYDPAKRRVQYERAKARGYYAKDSA